MLKFTVIRFAGDVGDDDVRRLKAALGAVSARTFVFLDLQAARSASGAFVVSLVRLAAARAHVHVVVGPALDDLVPMLAFARLRVSHGMTAAVETEWRRAAIPSRRGAI